MKSVKVKNKIKNGAVISQKGIVVFLDAVGTKTVWNRNDPAEYIKSWENVVEAFRKEEKSYKKLPEYIKKYLDLGNLNIRAFSDTIILSLSRSVDTFKKNTSYPFDLNIAIILIAPLYKAIIKEGIYLRGVISFGEFYITNSIIIGPAVEEAAEWYEKSEWFGVSTTPSATYGLKLMNEHPNFSDKFFINYDVPMKNNQQLNSYAVLWPNGYPAFAFQPQNKRKKIFKGSRKKLLESFSSSGLIGVSSELKYKNTLAFFDYVAGLDDNIACVQCGIKMPKNNKFCSACGTKTTIK